MAYWADDAALLREQRRLDENQARAYRRLDASRSYDRRRGDPDVRMNELVDELGRYGLHVQKVGTTPANLGKTAQLCLLEIAEELRGREDRRTYLAGRIAVLEAGLLACRRIALDALWGSWRRRVLTVVDDALRGRG